MSRWLFLLIVLCVSLGNCPARAADVFDRHVTHWLRQGVRDQQPLAELTMAQGLKIPRLDRQADGPCIVVKTNDGNWTKAVVTWGFRKGPKQPVPVLLLNRYVTYRGDNSDTTVAAGKDVMLFAGFGFNFDIGQVVPAGQGADVEFTDKALLQPVDTAALYVLNGSQLPASADAKPDPNDHEGVLPRDYAGDWTVNADGRWKGRWTLAVDESGTVTGTYISDETQSSYAISGKPGAVPHNLKLTIAFVNSNQTVDAWLWTKDKSTLAGTVTLEGRQFGFYAVRAEQKAAE